MGIDQTSHTFHPAAMAAAAETRNETDSYPRSGIRGPTRGIVRRIEQWRKVVLEARLLAYREDLSDWLNNILGTAISEATLMQRLENGVLLCQLAQKITKQEADWRYALPGKTRAPATIAYTVDTKLHAFQARNNVSTFLRWATDIGVPPYLLFETDDLVLHKNEKQVLNCLMDVTRTQRVFQPSSIMVAEQEAVAALSGRSLSPTRAAECHRRLNTCLGSMGRPPVGKPDTFGRYVLDAEEKNLVFVSVCGGLVMARAAPREWVPLVTFLDNPNVTANTLPLQSQEELLQSIRRDMQAARKLHGSTAVAAAGERGSNTPPDEKPAMQSSPKDLSPALLVPSLATLLPSGTPAMTAAEQQKTPRSVSVDSGKTPLTAAAALTAAAVVFNQRYRAKASPNPRFAAEFNRKRQELAAKFQLRTVDKSVTPKSASPDRSTMQKEESAADGMKPDLADMVDSLESTSDFEEITSADVVLSDETAHDTSSDSRPPSVSHVVQLLLRDALSSSSASPPLPRPNQTADACFPATAILLSPSVSMTARDAWHTAESLPASETPTLTAATKEWHTYQPRSSIPISLQPTLVPKTQRRGVWAADTSFSAEQTASSPKLTIHPPLTRMPNNRYVRAVHRTSASLQDNNNSSSRSSNNSSNCSCDADASSASWEHVATFSPLAPTRGVCGGGSSQRASPTRMLAAQVSTIPKEETSSSSSARHATKNHQVAHANDMYPVFPASEHIAGEQVAQILTVRQRFTRRVATVWSTTQLVPLAQQQQQQQHHHPQQQRYKPKEAAQAAVAVVNVRVQ